MKIAVMGSGGMGGYLGGRLAQAGRDVTSPSSPEGNISRPFVTTDYRSKVQPVVLSSNPPKQQMIQPR
jgi:predicted dinucleotide-binding enzyme